jgi:16S rRNA (adenine1518-N6/adenine1519-N6)-dimethyltransferase
LSVIEIDRDLAVTIANRFRTTENFSVLTEDALRTDFLALGADKPIRVVGNLPYNISTPLLLALIAQSAVIVDMTFMLQKEVVERLAALPDTRDYGRLTVMVQSQCDVEAHFDVSPDAFVPPPKVMSKLVRITPHSQPLPNGVRSTLEECARIAFGQRRKTLNNTLGKHYEHAVIEACGIDLGQRPGEISVGGFVRLAEALSREK